MSEKISLKMPNKNNSLKGKLIYLGMVFILSAVSAFLAACNINLNLKVTDLENEDALEIIIDQGGAIELAEDQTVLTKIETEDETIEVLQAPVVEIVDGGEIQVVEEELDLGKGEYYPYDTPQAFRDATLGKCIDLDGKYGAQCVDLSNLFWKEYANRWMSTCNTGTARGIWDCREQNAGQQFDLIEHTKDLQAGDWIVFDGGQYGHIGMALGRAENGYIALLGENQGGTSCLGGGSATNIINISLKTFRGAFRPKIWNVPKAPDTGIPKPDEE